MSLSRYVYTTIIWILNSIFTMFYIRYLYKPNCRPTQLFIKQIYDSGGDMFRLFSVRNLVYTCVRFVIHNGMERIKLYTLQPLPWKFPNRQTSARATNWTNNHPLRDVAAVVVATCATVSVIMLITYRALIIDVKLDFAFNVGLYVYFCVPYFIMKQI
jgi:hypothetical protein